MDQFFLTDGYICNLDKRGKAKPYLNDVQSAAVYQVKVYDYAKSVIRRYQLKSVLDIGCGYGIKLKKIVHKECQNIVGIDNEDAIKHCKDFHNFGEWYADDIENSILNLDRKFDLIISSDVIEHLADPTQLIEYIKKYCHYQTHIILSTPDKDKIVGQNSNGPPKNIYHVREWNRSEFYNYLKNSGFQIEKHFLVGERITSLKKLLKIVLGIQPLKTIQVVHCLRNRNIS
jgi:SAM-dependent methyltransferase